MASSRPSLPGAGFRTGFVQAAAMLLATGATAGEPIREVQPGSAKKQPPAATTPSTPTATLLERIANERSLGPGIGPGGLPDAPVLMPSQPGKIDPEAQRRWALIYDKQKNWLIEKAAKINSPRKASETDASGRESADPSKDSVAKVSADRIRRATAHEEPKVDRTKGNANDPLDPSSADDLDATGSVTRKKSAKEDGTDDLTKPKPAIAFILGDLGNDDRAAESAHSGLGNDFFKAPPTPGAGDRQHERALGRGMEFDQLLGSLGGGTAGGFDTGRATQDRGRQFEAILGGGDSSGGLLAPPPIAAAAPRPDFSQGLGRINPIQFPGATALPAPAPVVPKFQPAPVFLQVPTRGL